MTKLNNNDRTILTLLLSQVPEQQVQIANGLKDAWQPLAFNTRYNKQIQARKFLEKESANNPSLALIINMFMPTQADKSMKHHNNIKEKTKKVQHLITTQQLDVLKHLIPDDVSITRIPRTHLFIFVAFTTGLRRSEIHDVKYYYNTPYSLKSYNLAKQQIGHENIIKTLTDSQKVLRIIEYLQSLQYSRLNLYNLANEEIKNLMGDDTFTLHRLRHIYGNIAGLGIDMEAQINQEVDDVLSIPVVNPDSDVSEYSDDEYFDNQYSNSSYQPQYSNNHTTNVSQALNHRSNRDIGAYYTDILFDQPTIDIVQNYTRF